MTEHKFTDEEIKKALECCKKNDCDNCPNDFGNCYANLARYALDLINRYEAEIGELTAFASQLEVQRDLWMEKCDELKAEIERLTVNMNAFGLGMKREKERADNARAEAIKEFAERLKEKGAYNSFNELIIFEDMIDTLVKEMTGETKPADTDFPKDYSYGY